MTLVVDASVAVRWYLPEKGAELAAGILLRDDDLIAPDHIIAEIGSAVWKRVRKNEVPLDTGVEILEQASQVFSTLFPSTELAAPAMRLAVHLNHPIYDCLYLALAHRDDASLVTADARLATLAEQVGIDVEMLG
jgi:predicted nucleic acid-binding protein